MAAAAWFSNKFGWTSILSGIKAPAAAGSIDEVKTLWSNWTLSPWNRPRAEPINGAFIEPACGGSSPGQGMTSARANTNLHPPSARSRDNTLRYFLPVEISAMGSTGKTFDPPSHISEGFMLEIEHRLGEWHPISHPVRI